MNEELEVKTGAMTPEEDYSANFMPAVHRIGRFTIAIAFVLSILPFLYFYFIAGYQVPASLLFTGVAAIAPLLLGGWISEPLTYWPVLGSAGTYMSYLAGNVMSMRFPVATAVQKNVDADIATPRGQVATIVGIAVSIVVNLVILLITVFAGGAIMEVLPSNVLHSFSYCIIGMIGAMILMRLSMGKGGSLGKNLLDSIPYILCGVGAWVLVNYGIKGISAYGGLIGVVLAIVIAYLKYRKDKAAYDAEHPEGGETA